MTLSRNSSFSSIEFKDISSQNLPAFFSAQASTFSERTALVFEEETMTYGEL